MEPGILDHADHRVLAGIADVVAAATQLARVGQGRQEVPGAAGEGDEDTHHAMVALDGPQWRPVGAAHSRAGPGSGSCGHGSFDDHVVSGYPKRVRRGT